MKQEIVDAGHNWVFFLMAGLGLTLAPHEYFGGLFLAMAGGSIVARHRRDPRKIWTVLGTAAFFATIMAIVWPVLEWDVPVQIVMAATGSASGWLVMIIIKIMNRVDSRAEDVADRVLDKVLPEDKE